VPSVLRLRQRLPLIVVLFLLIVLVMMVGLACACLSDHPMQALERALSAIPSLPALIIVWTFTALSLLATSVLVSSWRMPVERASPALLQRFLS
jgi:amino acid transporter